MDSEYYPDTIGLLKDGWAVRFNGKLEGARWKDRAGAAIHLRLLQEGKRKPQPEIRETR